MRRVLMGGMGLVLLGLLAFVLLRRDRQDTRRRFGGRAASCDMPPADVAGRDGATIRAWVLCPGRLATEVDALPNAMSASGRAAEVAAVLDVWNARRTVETAEPNGQLPPAEQAEAENAANASDPEARGASFDPQPLEGVEQSGALIQSPPAQR